MRKFNTEGLVVPKDHYCIPPLERLDLRAILERIGDKRYFVLHAPRQTGKTSALLALRDLLNSGAEGDFHCVYVNVEAAQAVREDVQRAMRVCARLTDEGQPVEVRQREGVTDHLHPESCAGRCEAAGEALTGARTGRATEHRKVACLECRDRARG